MKKEDAAVRRMQDSIPKSLLKNLTRGENKRQGEIDRLHDIKSNRNLPTKQREIAARQLNNPALYERQTVVNQDVAKKIDKHLEQAAKHEQRH